MRGLRFTPDTHEAKLWAIRPGESQRDYEARMWEAGLLPGRDDVVPERGQA